MAVGRPDAYIADQQGSIRLQLQSRVDAFNRELALKSAIPDTAHYDRLVFYRDAAQFGVDKLDAFLPHYHSL